MNDLKLKFLDIGAYLKEAVLFKFKSLNLILDRISYYMLLTVSSLCFVKDLVRLKSPEIVVVIFPLALPCCSFLS